MEPPEEEFVSEPIQPDAGTFNAAAMASGQPGLPTGFTWRKQHYAVLEVLQDWKQSEPEGHRPGNERYYRKHFYRIRTVCGRTMVLYAVRHMKPGENPRKRWWLYTIEAHSG